MKKFLCVLLTLSLAVALVSAFAVSAHAEEEKIDVTVGQSFEWGDQSEDLTTRRNWGNSKGVSPDGLWKYQFYALSKKVYSDMVYSSSAGGFAWSANAGSDDLGLGYARVRNFGVNFHPAVGADTVKVFTCPSGGTIQISTTVARASAVPTDGKSNGTSFAIYLEDRLIYPEAGNGEYQALTETTPQTIDVTVDVKAGERVRIHIGAMGNQGSDAVNMTNVVTYKAVNADVAEIVESTGPLHGTLTNPATYTIPDVQDNDGDTPDRDLPTKDDGGFPVAVVIVIVAVVVVAAAAVVVVVLKKKKQN